MSDGDKQVKGPAKTIRVSTDIHTRFRAYQHTVHADSAEQAMGLLLGDNVLRIPMPAAVMERWTAQAAAAGYPLDQWVAQRVEAYLEGIRTAPTVAPARSASFTPCATCTTPKSCQKGRQDPEACE